MFVRLAANLEKTGDVIQVKILGTYAMIDSGETDWKILVIDITDPLTEKFNHLSDIPSNVSNQVFTFLRDYKIPDGNPPNQFAFGGDLKDRNFALNVIKETHHQWHQLIHGQVDFQDGGISTVATREGKNVISKEAAEGVLAKQFMSYVRAKF